MACALSLGTLACSGADVQDDTTPPAAGSSSTDASSASASSSGGGEFMGQPATHWIQQLDGGEDAAERTRAVSALASIGPGVDGVTEALVGALADDEALVKTGANRTLTRFGPAVAPVLVDTLDNHANAAVRAGVAPVLGNWAADADVNAALCRALLEDEDAAVRTAAARGLTVAGADAVAAVGALTEALEEDESTDVRQFAALALGRIGPAAAEAIPTLEAAEQDPDRTVANAARSALRQIR
jgi:HEAT repeat protein